MTTRIVARQARVMRASVPTFPVHVYDVAVSNPFNQGNPEGEQPQQQKTPQPQHFSARVPEKVKGGVYCTGQVIHDSPKEFVIDFLQGLNRPFQVVARVVMHPATMSEF